MTPPKVLGVEMTRPDDNPDAWAIEFHSLSAWAELAGDTWDAFVGDTCVGCGDTLPEAVAAIERELLAIRGAIPAQPLTQYMCPHGFLELTACQECGT